MIQGINVSPGTTYRLSLFTFRRKWTSGPRRIL
jgi:hypothetical protein